MTERLSKTSTVQDADRLLRIGPSTIGPDLTLEQIARAYTQRPEAHVMCVVDAEKRLLGVISVRHLFEDVFAKLAPESMLADMRDPGKAARYSRAASARNARELMSQPVSVRPDSTVGEAFACMHNHSLEGLPIVDAQGVLVGYLDMAELLFAWLQRDVEA